MLLSGRDIASGCSGAAEIIARQFIAYRSMSFPDIAEELPRARFPGIALRRRPAGVAGDREGGEGSHAQIPVEHTATGIADDVARACDRIGRDRQARGQRLQHDDAERVGEAGEDEDIGARIDLRERLTAQRPEEDRIGKARFEIAPRRPVADDDLGAGKIEREEGGDVLLHRKPGHGEEDRSGAERQPGVTGTEEMGVDPRVTHA